MKNEDRPPLTEIARVIRETEKLPFRGRFTLWHAARGRTATSLFAQQRAKNVILFLGDAGGLPTLNAASIHGYKEPRSFNIQRMPHIGLSETSATDSWVTDSAARMTAIVTGRKVANGVLSLVPGADPKAEGTPLKTILKYAEEHGLSTGVISNVNMADATPAACYSHVDSRKKFGEIFEQVWNPRFGDGVDVVIGNGRKKIWSPPPS